MQISINPFSEYFLKAKTKADITREEQIVRNSQGVSHEESMLVGASENLYGSHYSTPVGEFHSNQAAFRSIFSNKGQKINTYREMSMFPEINGALTFISDEAITKDEHGKYVKLIIKKDIPTREEKHIRNVFDYIVDEVLKFDKNGWKLFRNWLIESELFIEKILNDEGNRIIGMKVLPAANTYPVYEGNVIKRYVQTTKKVSLKSLQYNSYETSFAANQICYIHWDDYSFSPLDVRGYLEASVRTWNQYKNLQDALLIYRLVRAPERRLWNVEAGRLPPGKSEEYLKGLVARYRKNYTYNPDTGSIDSQKMFQALTDDYWFIKREGQGTTVDTLQSGMNLGQLDDVNLFKVALYTSLQIPKSRWEDTLNTVTSNTAPGEITREELRFSKMVGRFRNRFKKLFIDFLVTQLAFSNQIDQKWIRESLFDVEYCEENAFAEQKKQLNLKSKLEILNMANALIASPDNPNAPFSQKYVMQEMWGWTEQEYQEQENQKASELSEKSSKEQSKEEAPAESEASPKPSQEMNTQNQESEAEDTGSEKDATPEGSSEQIPSDEGPIELP